MKRARRTPPSFVHKAVVRPRYSLTEMLLQIPEGAHIVDEEWGTLPPVGREIEPAAATLRAVQAMKRFMRQQRKRSGRAINLRRLIDEGRA